jgi:hypothetical protein
VTFEDRFEKWWIDQKYDILHLEEDSGWGHLKLAMKIAWEAAWADAQLVISGD